MQYASDAYTPHYRILRPQASLPLINLSAPPRIAMRSAVASLGPLDSAPVVQAQFSLLNDFCMGGTSNTGTEGAEYGDSGKVSRTAA